MSAKKSSRSSKFNSFSASLLAKKLGVLTMAIRMSIISSLWSFTYCCASLSSSPSLLWVKIPYWFFHTQLTVNDSTASEATSNVAPTINSTSFFTYSMLRRVRWSFYKMCRKCLLLFRERLGAGFQHKRWNPSMHSYILTIIVIT